MLSILVRYYYLCNSEYNKQRSSAPCKILCGCCLRKIETFASIVGSPTILSAELIYVHYNREISLVREQLIISLLYWKLINFYGRHIIQQLSKCPVSDTRLIVSCS